MKLNKNAHGFSFIGILIIVGVIGIVGLVSYNVYSRQQAKSDNSSTMQTAVNEEKIADDSGVPEITKTEDLTTAEKSVDSTSVELSADESQLDKELAF